MITDRKRKEEVQWNSKPNDDNPTSRTTTAKDPGATQANTSIVAIGPLEAQPAGPADLECHLECHPPCHFQSVSDPPP